MNNPATPEEFMSAVQKMRHAIIENGGQPDTIRISKAEIEKFTLFGMKILVVDWLPNDSFCIVSDDRSIRNGNTKNS